MHSLLKSEFLKLKWSNLYLFVIFSTIILFFLNVFIHNLVFLFSGDPYSVGDGIGFVFDMFLDKSNPTYAEITRTSLSITGFTWIFVLSFTVIYFLDDYNKKTIKLYIANGESPYKIYISKLIVISIMSALSYIFLVTSKYIFLCVKFKMFSNLNHLINFLKLAILNLMVIEVFILITLLLCILLRKSIGVISIMCFFTISLPMVYMMVWNNLDKQSILTKIYLKINPMYYWSTISAYNIDNNIMLDTILYIIILSVLLITLSCFSLNKLEVK